MLLKSISFRVFIITVLSFFIVIPVHAQINENNLYTGEASVIKPDNSYKQEIRVELRPIKSAALASALNARIIKLPFREGQRFNKGDLLVGFDCSVEYAEKNRAKAVLDGVENQAKVNRRLRELNSISNVEYTNSESIVAQAKADVEIITQKLKKCKILAPYSGIVSDVAAKEFENVNPGDELLNILDDHDLEVELRVPSKWLQWLKVGASFSVNVLETGKTYNAVIDRIGARIDPISQSIKIIGSIGNSKNILKPGMSGNARFTFTKK